MRSRLVWLGLRSSKKRLLRKLLDPKSTTVEGLFYRKTPESLLPMLQRQSLLSVCRPDLLHTYLINMFSNMGIFTLICRKGCNVLYVTYSERGFVVILNKVSFWCSKPRIQFPRILRICSVLCTSANYFQKWPIKNSDKN